MILQGRGDGTFRPTFTLSEAIGPPGSTMTATDVNRDGLVDLVVVSGDGQTVTTLFANADGSFTVGPQTTTGIQLSGNNQWFTALFGDFDGDGVAEAIGVTGEFVASALITIGVDGTAKVAPLALSVPAGMELSAVGDVNGDGHLDLVLVGGETVGLSLGRGDGTFADPTTIRIGAFDGAANIGDVNGDGRDDVVLAAGAEMASSNSNWGDEFIVASVYFGTASGLDATPTSFTFGSWAILPWGLGDFDGDHRADLLVDVDATHDVSGACLSKP